MIHLLVNQQPVDLFPDSSITIDEESPVFDKDGIPGGYSYPFNLPVTPRNRRVMGFPERLARTDARQIELPYQLYHDGRLINSGTISVTEAGDSYRANLKVGTGDLTAKAGDLKLADLDLGGERTWVWKTEYTYPEDDFTLFPIWNAKFYGEDNVWATLFAARHFRINSFENGAFKDPEGGVEAICPFPFVGYLLKRLFANFGLRVSDSVFDSDPDLSDLVIYTMRDIHRIETVYEETEVLLGINQYGEPETEIQMVGYTGRVLGAFNLVDCVPDMTVKDFLISLRNQFNLAYVIHDQDQVSIIKRKELVCQAPRRDITNLAIGGPSVIYLTPPKGLKLSWDHDPDDHLFSEDYFKSIDELREYLGDPLPNPAALSTINPRLNEIRYIESNDLFYRYSYFEFQEDYYRWQWVPWSLSHQNLILGEGSEVYHSKFSTLLMVLRIVPEQLVEIRVPHTEQMGVFEEASEKAEFSPRLLFYRGMVTGTDDELYPLGSCDNYDRTGQVLPGKRLSLRFQGIYGIFNQLWKEYWHWLQKRRLVRWAITDPSTLRFDEKYTLDGIHYLLKKRTINLTMEGIKPGDCEFYTV